ncbi:MAG TPA: uroporphyrinogen-III synthase [Aigarchaeota archaeon]|nr:uroporphyrinogen-III synthase [Aigarchaeota archaeon]
MKTQPLRGMKILIPRTEEDADSSAEIIKKLGGDPIPVKAVEIEYTEDLAKVDELLRKINEYHWVVFTSRNGVRIFADSMKKLGLVPYSIKCRIAAVCPSTTIEAMNKGLSVSFTPSRYLTETLAYELPDVKGSKILLIRSRNADDKMRKILTQRGAYVDEVRPYAVKPVSDINPRCGFEAIILTSPSVVDAIRRSRKIMEEIEKGALVCCIGPVTARAARKLGIRTDLVAEEHSFPGVVNALAERVVKGAGRT